MGFARAGLNRASDSRSSSLPRLVARRSNLFSITRSHRTALQALAVSTPRCPGLTPLSRHAPRRTPHREPTPPTRPRAPGVLVRQRHRGDGIALSRWQAGSCAAIAGICASNRFTRSSSLLISSPRYRNSARPSSGSTFSASSNTSASRGSKAPRFGDSIPYSSRKPWISLAWAVRLRTAIRRARCTCRMCCCGTDVSATNRIDGRDDASTIYSRVRGFAFS